MPTGSSRFLTICCLLFPLYFCALDISAQQTPVAASSPSASPSPTPTVFSPQTLADLKRLQQTALSSDYAYKQVAHLANNIGPRLSGSAQAAKAVEYVAGELRAVGCEVQLERVMVPRWVRGEETAALTQFPGQVENTTQKIVLCALGPSVPTPANGIEANVMAVPNFDALKSMPRDKVAGKIVLFNYPFDKQMAAEGRGGEAYGEAVVYRGDGPSAAARQGAVACLIRSVGGADYRLPHTGQTNYADHALKIPAGAVTAEDADLMADLIRQGPVKMKLILTPQQMPDVESFNVIGDIKGSEHPEQLVIVSGHLDSWDLGTGAIDDAAGVAVSMDAANLIEKLHLKPKRTIRVIAWMNEENGGRGHDAYAKMHANEFANYAAVMESDLGAAHPLGFNAKVTATALGWLKPVQNILASFGANIIKQTNHSPGSDIAPMANAGVPALGIMQDSRTYFNYHHTAADTLDKIAPQELRENVAAMAVMGYALATLPESLPR